MMWKEIKTWATNKGYKVDRKAIEGQEKKYIYSWRYNDIVGIAYSTNECAKSIYNHSTDNKFLQHQEEYANDLLFDYQIGIAKKVMIEDKDALGRLAK